MNAEENIRKLLNYIGWVEECRGCKKMVYWVVGRKSTRTAVDPDGEFHINTCAVSPRRKKDGKFQV